MQLVRTILFWILVLLSLATGGVKLFGFEQDQRIFAALGFSHTMTLLFGVVQVIGGLLLIWPQTRSIGAVVMVLTFIVATIALFAAGDRTFGAVSILFILLAALPLLPQAGG